MPKLPRTSGTAIVKALEHLGFVRVRQSGSHVIMRRGSKGCVVPMHSEVKIGTLAGVLRQAEVSTEEFMNALR
ncbi:MAG: type II toxin-antitoxin system HicA family toxin [Nitrospira sp. CG24E]|nr:MAG: type II toxin-antitoxin system HicA family toxin [Nitrospira sp. CG24E]